jgi:hypothetical protein
MASAQRTWQNPDGGIPMAWLVRIALLAGGAVAAWFVAPDAPNYSVVQGMMTVFIIAIAVFAAALIRRR